LFNISIIIIIIIIIIGGICINQREGASNIFHNFDLHDTTGLDTEIPKWAAFVWFLFFSLQNLVSKTSLFCIYLGVFYDTWEICPIFVLPSFPHGVFRFIGQPWA
jgi:hypothetical protein